ncbi:hypothetical protein DCS_00539 [Drechmeria coniospora]|uniref:Xylanolytic transcriptional activator regulatory domain-containing protein n=1 Tax=Drechmeria coniospora TaxID=98403 RepID=A0A151GQN0_DRECN|nr:hypothetical protein DCS_00539 [Drechmeria coniospora]KYK59409.1 hypothetical protein DCS_00539 [Drechmeria coniospora]
MTGADPPSLSRRYITGVAVRLAVDLGLHHEDGTDVEASSGAEAAAQDRGRRLWTRDMRRRLWWCTYSFDRLVSTCVGRPFGISDQVITTELPSLLDDAYITPAGFLDPPEPEQNPSCKHVAHHYFRLRMLQSEMLQVLQYNQAQLVRAGGNQRRQYPEMHTHLPSPFLVHFDSFRSWRVDIDRRLYQWRANAPTRVETGVAFSTEFLELNYWQAIIMLYRQSLSVPTMFEGEYNTSDEVNSPTAFTAELQGDEDAIYLKVAEAGQKILRIYRQLHLSGLVSYTYLSTHHLFMAGISYLYAIWHSPMTMDEVDFTVLAAKSVFTDMIDKCPPAETCRDAFDRTAKATIKMASSSGGFGAAAQQPRRQRREVTSWAAATPDVTALKAPSRHRHHPSDHASFSFDIMIPDSLSSPSLSATGDLYSPPPGQSKAFNADTFMPHPRSHGGPSPDDRTTSQDGASSIDPALVPSPASSRRTAPLESRESAAAMVGSKYAMQGTTDYPDAQAMDFLHTIGAARNGEVNGMDQAQLDLGFGINWEGMHNDYGEGPHVSPFDAFFFGGQQGGGGS